MSEQETLVQNDVDNETTALISEEQEDQPVAYGTHEGDGNGDLELMGAAAAGRDGPDGPDGPDAHDESEVGSRIEELTKKAIAFSKRRFWWFCLLGVLVIIVLHLSFLPRTSLNRDFRRLHGIRLTKNDVKRNYLILTNSGLADAPFTNEQHIDWWLTNLTQITGKGKTNLLHDDNEQLSEFVKKSFRQLGFEPETFTFDGLELRKPLGLSIRLVDRENGRVIYEADLFEPHAPTPAFSGFGFNGSFQGDYVFVNEATSDDFNLLINNGFDPSNKVVIARVSPTSQNLVAEKLEIAERYGAKGFIYYYEVTSDSGSSYGTKVESAIFRDDARCLCDDLNGTSSVSIPSIPVSLKSVKPILGTLSPATGLFEKWPHGSVKYSSTIDMQISSLFEDKRPRNGANIVGTIKGVVHDSEIVIGASRDSFASSNPLSNHAILLEIMRNFQILVKLGWKPFRSIKFVSWDGSRNGLLGSKSFLNETNIKSPVLCYINIDKDAVVGNHFSVASNPLFNHILLKTAEYVAIPKKLSKTDLEGNTDIEPWGKSLYSTLYHYWLRQDNHTINNYLGALLIGSDGLSFQNAFSTPIVNVKFDNDPAVNAPFIPNSNYASYEWLMGSHIDHELTLHGLMIKFLGLLLVSFSENEVVDMRTESYGVRIHHFFHSFLHSKELVDKSWDSRTIPEPLLRNTKLASDMRTAKGSSLTLQPVLNHIERLTKTLITNCAIFDDYADSVQEQWIKDFPWYLMLKKLKIFATFKLTNYKLLRLEKELTLNPNDYEYLNGSSQRKWFNHIIYGLPPFTTATTNLGHQAKIHHSVLPDLYQAVLDDDFDRLVKVLVIFYEKLLRFNRKIT